MNRWGVRIAGLILLLLLLLVLMTLRNSLQRMVDSRAPAAQQR